MTWPALYTGLAEHIALGEALRHTTYLPDLAEKRISRLQIHVQAALDGTSLVGAGHRGPGRCRREEVERAAINRASGRTRDR